MKYKVHEPIKYSYPLISFLNEDTIERINAMFGTHYFKQEVKTQIIIKRKEKGFDFWNKLIRTKPGFNRQGSHEEE